MRLLRVVSALLLAACSGKETSDPKNGGSAGTGSGSEGGAGEASSGGSSASSGGTPGSSGSGSGASGSGASGGGGADSAAGASGSAGAAGAGGEGALVSCDHRQVLCKAAEPSCPEMQVAKVEDGCWGPCVDIELCACASAGECPHEETYTCWSKQHCGPYVR